MIDLREGLVCARLDFSRFLLWLIFFKHIIFRLATLSQKRNLIEYENLTECGNLTEYGNFIGLVMYSIKLCRNTCRLTEYGNSISTRLYIIRIGSTIYIYNQE